MQYFLPIVLSWMIYFSPLHAGIPAKHFQLFKPIADTNLVFDNFKEVNKYIARLYEVVSKACPTTQGSARSVRRCDSLRNALHNDIRLIRIKFLEYSPLNKINFMYLVGFPGMSSGSDWLKRIEKLYERYPDSMRNSAIGKEIRRAIDKKLIHGLGKNLSFLNNSKYKRYEESMVFLAATPTYKIVDIWASWCLPCRVNLRELKRIYGRFDRSRVSIVGLSIDTDVDRWKRAIRNDGYPWVNICDTDGWKSSVIALLGIQSIPFQVILDHNDVVIAVNPSLDKLRQMGLLKKQ